MGQRQVGDLAAVPVPAARLPQVHVYDTTTSANSHRAPQHTSCVYRFRALRPSCNPLTSTDTPADSRICLHSAEVRYFIGLIGRSRVMLLKADGVEQPSDLDGVVYTPFDEHGAWRLALARELEAAGI
ncbi:MAG: TIR domain-containing protein [Acidimicrobiales bacterium]